MVNSRIRAHPFGVVIGAMMSVAVCIGALGWGVAKAQASELGLHVSVSLPSETRVSGPIALTVKPVALTESSAIFTMVVAAGLRELGTGGEGVVCATVTVTGEKAGPGPCKWKKDATGTAFTTLVFVVRRTADAQAVLRCKDGRYHWMFLWGPAVTGSP